MVALPLATILVTGVISGAGAQGLLPACDMSVPTPGSWTTIPTRGPVRAYAVSPSSPIVLYVTDGTSVYKTSDRGCSWTEIFIPGDAGNGAQALNIVDIVIPESASAVDRIYLLAQREPTNPCRPGSPSAPAVVMSPDGGRSWTVTSDGLPSVGGPMQLVIAPSDPEIAYVTVRVVAKDTCGSSAVPGFHEGVEGTAFYRSVDAGRSWSIQSVSGETVVRWETNGDTGQQGHVRYISVDPLESATVWAATTRGLTVSRDGGSTWDPGLGGDGVLYEGGNGTRVVDVFHTVSQASSVIAIDPETGTIYRSDAANKDTPSAFTTSRFFGFRSADATYLRGGLHEQGVWIARGLPGTSVGASPATSRRYVPPANMDDELLVASPNGVYQYGWWDQRWMDVSPPGSLNGEMLVDVSADNTVSPFFFARPFPVADRLLMYNPIRADTALQGLSDAEFRRLVEGPITVRPGTSPPTAANPWTTTVPEPPVTQLTPRDTALHLGLGQEETVPYRLRLKRPTPTDVYFLVDSTGSMIPVIRGMARVLRDIVTELQSHGIDLWAGLGEFRTYSPAVDKLNNDPSDFVYRRDVNIASPGQALATALAAMKGQGYSGANLTALYQAATGEGQDVNPPGPSENDISPEMQADFRADAIKVIFHVADTRFGTPERGDPNGYWPAGTYPSPDFPETIQALKAREIYQIGIALNSNGDGQIGPDMEVVAEGTGALVAGRGLDCDGDDVADRVPGEPAICYFDPTTQDATTVLTKMVVNLISSLRDEAPVRIVELSDSSAITGVTPSFFPAVNLRKFHDLPFDVTYRCPSVGVHHVRLGAQVRDEVVATATATVTCSLLPPVPPPPIGLAVPPIVVEVIPVPGPAPAAAPAPASAAAPVPAPAPNPVPVAQANPVAVAQRQQQHQLATVQVVQEVKEKVALQNAMVRLHRKQTPVEMLNYGFALGALSLIAMFGTAGAVMRSRLRVSVSSVNPHHRRR